MSGTSTERPGSPRDPASPAGQIPVRVHVEVQGALGGAVLDSGDFWVNAEVPAGFEGDTIGVTVPVTYGRRRIEVHTDLPVNVPDGEHAALNVLIRQQPRAIDEIVFSDGRTATRARYLGAH